MADFDPSIILQGMRPVKDPLETVRSLQDMVQAKQQHQFTLASLMDKQNQERAFNDSVRQNADNPGAITQDLMRRGLGQRASEWMTQQSEIGSRDASRQKAMADMREHGTNILRSRAAVVKTPEQYAQFIAPVPPQVRAELGLPDQFEPTALSQFVAAGVSPEKRADLERQAQVLEETTRHHKKEEDRPPGGAPGLTIITGDGGALSFVDPRNPNAPAKPVLGPDGEQIHKPSAKQQRPMTKGDRDALEQSAGEQANLTALIDRFRPEFANKGGVGQAIVGLKKKAGSWAPESAQEEANFWADFQGMFDIARRNKMFGASLTPSENASWEAAKTVTPNSDHRVALKALERLRDASAASMRRRGTSLAKDGYSSDAIEVYTGSLAGGGKPQSAEMVTISDGKETLTIPVRRLAEAEKEGFKRVTP